MNITEQQNNKTLRAINSLSLFRAIGERVNAKWDVMEKLGTYGFGDYFEAIEKDNKETQDEMIVHFTKF